MESTISQEFRMCRNSARIKMKKADGDTGIVKEL